MRESRRGGNSMCFAARLRDLTLDDRGAHSVPVGCTRVARLDRTFTPNDVLNGKHATSPCGGRRIREPSGSRENATFSRSAASTGRVHPCLSWCSRIKDDSSGGNRWPSGIPCREREHASCIGPHRADLNKQIRKLQSLTPWCQSRV